MKGVNFAIKIKPQNNKPYNLISAGKKAVANIEIGGDVMTIHKIDTVYSVLTSRTSHFPMK